MDFIEIENKIKKELETLKWEDKVFNNVYNYYTLENDEFPYVWFELTEENYTQKSNHYDTAEWLFHIYIFQEINENDNIDRNKARNIIKKWVKEIQTLFRNKYTLDWNVNNCKIENIKYDTFIDEKWIIYNALIQLKVEFDSNIDII